MSLNGISLIKKELETIQEVPGVYRMIGADEKTLYVGKAKNLKKRLTSYTILYKLVSRMQRAVLQTEKLEVIITRTETEALLLEANLIKNLKPRYNIILKDDKSFPYITITGDQEFPRIAKHRGEKKPGSLYFGPYASAGDVNSAISTLQKAFLLRPCADNVFANRMRPCLEYQIKRCSAPCVGKISKENYAELVRQAKDFLTGKSHEVQQEITVLMEKASSNHEYEKAAVFRDRIKALSAIQARQNINTRSVKEADVIAIDREPGLVGIQIMFVRNYQLLGSKSLFPIQTEDYNDAEIMEAFISDFYQSNPVPELLILNNDVCDKETLIAALATLKNSKVYIEIPQRGEKFEMVKLAVTNVRDALNRKIKESRTEIELLSKVAELFGIDGEIKRIEVYDNSHIFGQHAVGAMIVAGPEGFIKKEYRKFNVTPGEKTTGGDDYWMFRQVLTCRFSKLRQDDTENKKPDLVLIDGGAAHLKIAEEVFADLGINDIVLICIAKGPNRNAGREEFHITGKTPFRLSGKDEVLYYLQRLRDEAHRFAISFHRNKRLKLTSKSVLDEIPGIGGSRKKALLNHFGSVRGITEATIEELMSIKGINRKIAEIIKEYIK